MKVYELLRDVFMRIGAMKTGTVTTGGSDTLITDTKLSLTADQLINGSLMMLSGDRAGEVKRITDNAATTITIEALSGNTTAGDIYGYVSKSYREEQLLIMVNEALAGIGRIGIKDTSLTTADSKTEYTLPVAIKAGNIRGVYIQTNSDSDDNKYDRIMGWRVIPNVAGTGSTLVLRDQPASSKTLLIEYTGLHPQVTAFTDEIHESIHPELAKAALRVALFDRRAENAVSSQDGFNMSWNKAIELFEAAKREYPVKQPDLRPSMWFAGRN